MASDLKAWWMLSVVLVVSNGQHCWTSADATPQVPCYFIFGDSFFDNGNNNYLKTKAQANYLPYGIDFLHGSSGRVSNGLNLGDIMAKQLGFSNHIPSFAMGTVDEILIGVNYASAGSGILRNTGYQLGQLFTMDIQLDNHQIIASRIGKIFGSETLAKKYLSHCIYSSNIGNNDFLVNYYAPSQYYNTSKEFTPEEFSNLLILKYQLQLERLYEQGARKVALFGPMKIGCMPWYAARFGKKPSSCATELNVAAKLFNKGLLELVYYLNKNLPGAKFTFINSYEIDSQTSLGFKVTNAPCCNTNVTNACTPLTSPCSNRNEYVYWDGVHFTEAKAWAFGRRAYKRQPPSYGQETDAQPYDISELAELPIDDYYSARIKQLAQL